MDLRNIEWVFPPVDAGVILRDMSVKDLFQKWLLLCEPVSPFLLTDTFTCIACIPVHTKLFFLSVFLIVPGIYHFVFHVVVEPVATEAVPGPRWSSGLRKGSEGTSFGGLHHPAGW